MGGGALVSSSAVATVVTWGSSLGANFDAVLPTHPRHDRSVGLARFSVPLVVGVLSWVRCVLHEISVELQTPFFQLYPPPLPSVCRFPVSPPPLCRFRAYRPRLQGPEAAARCDGGWVSRKTRRTESHGC